jgi:hypothetical protein
MRVVMTESVKKDYEAPTLTVYGSFEEVTQAGSRTGSLDGNYPQGTPDDFGGGLFS